MELHTAKKEEVRLRIGISAPSGFGKTYSALKMAYGMTGDYSKIAIIDTESGSAHLYADMGHYNVLTLSAPFSPERYIEAMEACEKQGMVVIIIDSISHEWSGDGGCLTIHEQLGGRFQDWAKVTPRHQQFIDKILNSPAHVITTTRRKTDYSLDPASNGKTKVVKHGTKEITREGFEYELTVNFEILNAQHLVVASKDRTGLYMNKPEFVISSATGKKLIVWSKGQDFTEDLRREIKATDTLHGLKDIYHRYSDYKEYIRDDLRQRKAELESVSKEKEETLN